MLAVARLYAQNNVPESTFSSYDTGRNGYAAFYELLRRENVAVRRFEQPHGLLDRSLKTLILAVPSEHLGKNESLAIREWLTGGGVLIVLTPDGGDREIAGITVPQTHTANGARGRAHVLRTVALTHGVRSIAGSGTSVFDSLHKQTAALLWRHGAPIAVEFRFGKGRVIAVSDPTIFSNAQLTRDDNARFAYNLTSAYAPVAFDETAQGYSRTQNIWQVLPVPVHVALLIMGGAAGLALIGNNVRFGPLTTLVRDERQSSSTFIDSMASLMERGKARQQAVRDLIDLTLRNVGGRLGDLHSAHVLELQRLRAQHSPSDKDLIRAAEVCALLRKEYGEYGNAGSARRAAYSKRRS